VPSGAQTVKVPLLVENVVVFVPEGEIYVNEKGAVPVKVAEMTRQSPGHRLGLPPASENCTVGSGRYTTARAFEKSKQGSLKSTLPFRLLPAMAAT